MADPVTYTAVLPISRGIVQCIAALRQRHRFQLGTRTGGRALGVFAHAVLICRFLLGATRTADLARDNGSGSPPATATSTRPSMS